MLQIDAHQVGGISVQLLVLEMVLQVTVVLIRSRLECREDVRSEQAIGEQDC